MKKPIILTLAFIISLLLFSCEDQMEGEIYPAQDVKDFQYSKPTHWVFSYDTEDKSDGVYMIGSNPDTHSKIYITIYYEGVINAWSVKQLNFTSTYSEYKNHNDFDLTDKLDPKPGKPLATRLPILLEKSPCSYNYFCNTEACIYVKQLDQTTSCMPQMKKINVYIPLGL